MKISKALARDKKQARRKYGMRVTGRSIFTIVSIQVHKSKETK